MGLKSVITAVMLSTALSAPAPLALGQPPAVIPMERDKTLETLPFGGGDVKRQRPDMGRVGIKKEGISADAMGKKDPLVTLTTPKAGTLPRAYQKVSGRVGGGIAKAFLRINDDTQMVTVTDGAFEAYGALRPGLNTITVLAWDLEGNIGKDSLKVFYRPPADGPKVEVRCPKQAGPLDITEDRVITVEAVTDDKALTEGVLVLNNIPRRVGFEGGAMRQELALLPGVNEIYVEVEDGKGRIGRSGTVKFSTFDARPKDLVAVLTWDSPTADFDLHVWDSFGHHTFNDAKDAYQCDASIPGGMLDMDRKGGYGPEVFSLEGAESEVYTFYAKYNPGLMKEDAGVYMRLLLHGGEPSRRIMRSFGPMLMGDGSPVWEAAHVKMPEGVFFQEKDMDLVKTLGMDKKAVKRLARMLTEESTAFRLIAVSAMGQIKSEEAVAPLLDALGSGTAEVRRAAAGALWNIRSVKSVDGLVRALKDEDPEVRQAAAGALGAIGEKGVLPALTGLLTEEGDQPVRIEVIKALGMIGDNRALDILVSEAKDTDPLVRAEALRSIGGLKDGRAEEMLVGSLRDISPGVREVAACALGKLGKKTSLKPLTDALYFDDSEGVRVQAAIAIGRLKEESALDDLGKVAQQDPSPRVRFCAGKAVCEIAKPDVKPEPLPPIQLDEDVIAN